MSGRSRRAGARRAAPVAFVAFVALALLATAASGCGGSDGSSVPSSTSDGARPTTVATVTERIALVRDQRLLVRAPDGAERLLFRPEGSNVFPAFPAWSPDGSRIAFVQSVFAVTEGGDHGDGLYVIDAAGGQDPQLVRAHAVAGEQILGVAWTADGARLLIGLGTPRTANDRVVGFDYAIQRVDVATGTATALVDGAIEPSLSRDGTRLAYLVPGSNNDTAIWEAAADGSDARAVPLPDTLQPPFGPRISPDGSQIAFSAPTNGAFSARPADDTGRRRIARSLLPFMPRRAEAHGVPMEVWRVDIATDTPSPLTSFGEDDPRSAWDPDGATLIVIGASGLYRVGTSGGDVERIDDGAFAGQIDVR